jgi:hypothetical protein
VVLFSIIIQKKNSRRGATPFIMEKKKITLDTLRVSSFVTPLNEEEQTTIKGGYTVLQGKRKLMDTKKFFITSSDVRTNTGKKRGV